MDSGSLSYRRASAVERDWLAVLDLQGPAGVTAASVGATPIAEPEKFSFFAPRGVGTARGPSAGSPASFDVVPAVYLIPPDYPVRGMSRTEAGLVIDRELVKLAGIDHRCRIVQARLSRRLMQTRGWRRHGFVRLSDYAREKLGCSPRTLQEDARVLTALDALPLIRAALDGGTVSWTQARLLAGAATAQSESELLSRAGRLTTRELEEFLQRGSAQAAAMEASHDKSTPTGHDDGNVVSTNPHLDTSSAAACNAPTTDHSGIGNEPEDEPIVRWSTPISGTGKRLWRCVREVASRTAGASLSDAQALELVVAEAASGEPEGAAPGPWLPDEESLQRRLLQPCRRAEEARRKSLEAYRELAGVIDGFKWLDPASREPGPAERLNALVHGLDTIDAFELERRLREVRRVAQRIDYQLGALARLGSDRRLFREVGFATMKLYAEGRLGMSASRLSSLIAIERESWRRGHALRSAWREGRISHLAAATLLPVIDDTNGDAWVRRAGEVTLRRLADEVAWALDHGERDGISARPSPPPLDASIPPGGLSSVDLAEVQMRARGESPHDEFGPGGGARLAFQLPVSVAVLLETQVLRYRHRRDPSWRSFERVVAHALLEWTAAPKHRDPIFERDGWRCAVPGCTSRRNLHDHHVVFRSLGGGHEQTNRITLCADHHLHAIHTGIVRVEGRAPDRLVWTMPFMRLVGDRYCPTLH